MVIEKKKFSGVFAPERAKIAVIFWFMWYAYLYAFKGGKGLMIFIGAVSLFGDLRPSINFPRPNRRTQLKTTCSDWD